VLVSGPHCLNCINAPFGIDRLNAYGSGDSGILLLGDSPYKNEQITKIPFSGPAGQLLNRILERLSIKRESLTITNSICCSPPHLGWTDHPSKYPEAIVALRHCEPYLKDTLDKQRPKVIVALGNVAMRQAIGNINIAADLTQRHSYVHESQFNIPVIPSFHPSYLLQGKHKFEICLMFAIRRAQEIANGTYRESIFNLLLDPPIEDARRYLREYVNSHGRIRLLMVDIETPESTKLDEEEFEEKGLSYHIDRAGFSLDERSGISFPYKEPYISLLQEAIDHADTIAEWADNHFDTRRLSAAGHAIRGRVVSGMWAWHFYQSDLLKGLGFVAPFFYAGPPFKHLASSQPALYNCLRETTKVPLWDGGQTTIGKLVRNKVEATLIGMDRCGQMIPVKVIDWHKQSGGLAQKWLRISTESFDQPIECTPDHIIWTSYGWRSAEDIREGDELFSSRWGSRDLIWGTILGDGHVCPRNRLSIGHSIKQVEWFNRKYNALGGATKPYLGIGGYGRQHWTTDAWVAPEWRERFYNKDGKKRFVPPPSSAALAVWYCDDGCYPDHDHDWYGNPRIAIFGFTNQDDVLDWASDKYGIDNISLYNIAHNGFSLALKGRAVQEFFSQISPYIPPEMQHKLHYSYREAYNGWMEIKVPQKVRVTGITEFNRWGSKYCVTIDHPTHRFFTLGGLVKNCLDNAVGRACTVGSMEKLAQEGRLDRFLRHCVDADKIYVKMGQTGVMLDTDHHSKFINRLKAEYDSEVDSLQPLVDDKIKPVKLWKKQPKDMTGVIELPLTSTTIDGKMAKEMIEAAKGTVSDSRFKAAKKQINELRNPYRYKRIEPFNPNSPIQMKALIRSLGLKVPVDRDGETTGAKHLKRFTKYPIFHKILIAKQKGKMISSYNWQVDERGRIKTTYGYHPSTLRKSSRNYNLQVIPKRSDLADEFRRSIVAAPGHYFVTSDASAIEAVLVGYDAASDSYIRLAKSGLHGWMTAAYHGQPISLTLDDKELAKQCKAAKKKWPVDYEVLKRVDHLSNYLGTPYRIYEEYPEEFDSPITAGRLQNFYFSTEPGKQVRLWQSRVMQEAHKNNYLDNHFNYRHYFYSVFKRDAKTKQWIIDHDGDAKRAVAFRPQSDASAIQTEVILRLAEGYDNMIDWLRLIIHDETVAEVPEDQVEYAATILHTEMTRPIPELPLKTGGYLSIGAETKYGHNLASYNEETNPTGMREMIVTEVDDVVTEAATD
jgi:uracil-DNA glycosylase family 4